MSARAVNKGTQPYVVVTGTRKRLLCFINMVTDSQMSLAKPGLDACNLPQMDMRSDANKSGISSMDPES